MSWKFCAGLLKGQPDSSQVWVPWEPDSAQGGEVEVLAVHSDSLASDLAFASQVVSMGSFGVAPGDSSEMASADTPEVAPVGTSEEAGTLPGKAILANAGEHRDPYLHPRREGQSSVGQTRQFVPCDREIGRRRERDDGEEETETKVETVEAQGGLSVVHFGPSGGKAVVPKVDLDLGKG